MYLRTMGDSTYQTKVNNNKYIKKARYLKEVYKLSGGYIYVQVASI
jgi:hypothetical protein